MKRKFKHIDQYQQKGQSFLILYHWTQNTTSRSWIGADKILWRC